MQIASVISDPPEYVQTAKVFDMLIAVPKYGKVKATRFLNPAASPRARPSAGLSERQRSELVELLEH